MNLFSLLLIAVLLEASDPLFPFRRLAPRKFPAQVPIPETLFPPPNRPPLPVPTPFGARPEGYWGKGLYGGSFGSYVMGFSGLPPTEPVRTRGVYSAAYCGIHTKAPLRTRGVYPAAYGSVFV
eukprot:Gregarina_sp_Poly_1__9858@NODE_637_length_7019_cov_92_159235_g486_i0_p5_GENE_NODE_637_length_7019_cov_92_159235_g486_i0NODE_637_length_7019_cov_92_159235_g486_i0_p5_ORF_typecomplete_len123_score3_49_NODE_637_length_7019_cov_92_159235_g486_i018386